MLLTKLRVSAVGAQPVTSTIVLPCARDGRRSIAPLSFAIPPGKRRTVWRAIGWEVRGAARGAACVCVCVCVCVCMCVEERGSEGRAADREGVGPFQTNGLAIL